MLCNIRATETKQMYVSLFEQCYVSNKNKITSLAISYTGAYFLDLYADLEEGGGDLRRYTRLKSTFNFWNNVKKLRVTHSSQVQGP